MPPPTDPQAQIQELRARLAEAEDTLRAIRSGEVDALVIEGPGGPQTFTLQGADQAYRVMLEEMTEGAATVSVDGTVLYCNRRFAEMLGRPAQTIAGAPLDPYVQPEDRRRVASLMRPGGAGSARFETVLHAAEGREVPVFMSLSSLSSYEVPAVCLVATDLREQKRDEAILAEGQLARQVFDQAAEAIFVLD